MKEYFFIWQISCLHYKPQQLQLYLEVLQLPADHSSQNLTGSALLHSPFSHNQLGFQTLALYISDCTSTSFFGFFPVFPNLLPALIRSRKCNNTKIISGKQSKIYFLTNFKNSYECLIIGNNCVCSLYCVIFKKLTCKDYVSPAKGTLVFLAQTFLT